MQVRAVAKYTRISSTKVRKVAMAVKGWPVEDALGVLGHMPQRSGRILGKVIRSAVANAGSRASVIRVLASIGSWFRNTAIWPPSLDRTPIARPIPPYSSANTTIAAHAGPTGRKSVFRTGVFKDGRNASRLASESAKGSDERLNMNHASATSRES